MDQTPTDSRIETRGINRPVSFSLSPDAETCTKIAAELGIRGIRKLRFEGVIRPRGSSDLELLARIGVTVIQDCVVTLEPVTTRIDEDIVRVYLADLTEPEGEEVEMPEDETEEQKPAVLDLQGIMVEAIALALPEFPRAEGLDPVEMTITEPGKTPLSDDDVKPFAALKSLRDKLDGTDGEKG